MKVSFRDSDEPWDLVTKAGIAFIVVLMFGTVSYRVLGLGWFDAFYQTLITVSTVGYGEVGDDITSRYRIISSLLILFGVGIGVYSIGLVFGALMEGRLTDRVGKARMRKDIEKSSGHVVVCGWGQVGKAISLSLVASSQRVVVIDRRPRFSARMAFLTVVGEATDDNVLKAAGVERAKCLVVALDGESDNLFVTLSGRALNPELFIVTRAVGANSGPKLELAGADRVVNPHEIGASRMSSFVMQPNVADFLGETMTDHTFQVRLGEVKIDRQSPLAGRSLDTSGYLEATGLVMLAVRSTGGDFVHLRHDEFTPGVGEVLIVLGTAEQHAESEAWLAAARTQQGQDDRRQADR